MFIEEEKECVICFFEEPCLVLDCGHGVCKDMLEGHIKESINQNLTLVCPEGKCKREIDLGKLVNIISDELYKKLDEQALKRVLGATVPCPTLNCPNCFFIDEADKERDEIFCDACFNSFCPKCLDLCHYHVSCDDYKILKARWTDYLNPKEDKENKAEFLLFKDEIWKATKCRHCPYCGNLIEKLDGCNNMRCGGDPYLQGGKNITFINNQQKGCGRGFTWNMARPYHINDDFLLRYVDEEKVSKLNKIKGKVIYIDELKKILAENFENDYRKEYEKEKKAEKERLRDNLRWQLEQKFRKLTLKQKEEEIRKRNIKVPKLTLKQKEEEIRKRNIKIPELERNIKVPELEKRQKERRFNQRKDLQLLLLLVEDEIKYKEDKYKDYNLLTVEELKAELRHRKLKVSGRKAELIQRLEDNKKKPVKEEEKKEMKKAKVNYNKMTVIQLKAELRNRKLKVGGLKAELIQRLENDDKKKPVKEEIKGEEKKEPVKKEIKVKVNYKGRKCVWCLNRECDFHCLNCEDLPICKVCLKDGLKHADGKHFFRVIEAK